MHWIVFAPIVFQNIAMFFDEFWFHRRRDLPLWERIGHPLDTLTVLAGFAWIFARPPTPANIAVYLGLAVFSCAFVLKDERVHFEACSLGEQRLHAALFVCHPLTFLAFGLMWSAFHGAPLGISWLEGSLDARRTLLLQGAATVGIFLYQVIYWNVLRAPAPARRGA